MKRTATIWLLAATLSLLAALSHGAERHYVEQQASNTHIAIFVHGVLGNHLETWGKLPELLQADASLAEYDFLFWGYPSKLFGLNEEIGSTGKHLKTEIDYLSKPYEKVVLIGHSMGGLVIRSYIVQALIDGKGGDLSTIADVMLFGVPNEGVLKAGRAFKWFNDQIADMGVASEFITELRKYWIQRVTSAPQNDDFHQRIPTIAVAGYQDQVVSQQSVESYFQETAMTDGNHRSMVKPGSTSHLTYRIIRKRLIETSKKPIRRASKAEADIQAIVEKLMERHRQELEGYQQREQAAAEQIKSLTDAVTALAEQKDQPDAPPGIEDALAQLKQGNTEQAERIFAATLERKADEGKRKADESKRKADEAQAAKREAAAAARHLGALAFLHDTDKALAAYRRAVSLDSENAVGWNRLGHLLDRVGDLGGAEKAYLQVLRLGESATNDTTISVAYGNLGLIYQTRGELGEAE